eukprot:15336572-Ditylum_brightwellii.AAC.2
MSPGVEARKIDKEEIVEVLENWIFTSWKFQMDKDSFNTSSSAIKGFTKKCVCYKECKPMMPKKLSTACKSHLEGEGEYKAKCKVDEKGHCN